MMGETRSLTTLNNYALNPREKAFLSEYTQHFNATRACSAIYNVSSYGSARSYGCQLLKKPRLIAVIQQTLETFKIERPFLEQKLLEAIEAPAFTAAERMARIKAIETAARLMGYIGKNNKNDIIGLDKVWETIR
jgi:phage terminase small subunit